MCFENVWAIALSHLAYESLPESRRPPRRELVQNCFFKVVSLPVVSPTVVGQPRGENAKR